MNVPKLSGVPPTGVAPDWTSLSRIGGSSSAALTAVLSLAIDRRWRLRRREQPIPVRRVGVGIALLGERRYVRQDCVALVSRRADRHEVAGLDLCDEHRHVGGQHVDLSAEQIGQSRSCARVGHVKKFHARRRGEQLLRQMRRASRCRSRRTGWRRVSPWRESTSSLTVLMPSFGGTTSTSVTVVTSATGAKSRSAS